MGGPGGWYYVVPPPPGSLAPTVLTLFTAINQSFFMSLFFAISGYVTPASYDAKGPGPYLRDRLARLGIPLVVYFFVLNPVLVYLAARFLGLTGEGLFAFVTRDYRHTVGTGPLWFVLALLIFAFVYAGLRIASGRTHEHTGTRPFPTSPQILGFVLAIGVVAFIVRLVFPTGWQILGLQLGCARSTSRSSCSASGPTATAGWVSSIVADPSLGTRVASRPWPSWSRPLPAAAPHRQWDRTFPHWPTRVGPGSAAISLWFGAVPSGPRRRERWRTAGARAPPPTSSIRSWSSAAPRSSHGRRSIRCSASSSSACSR